MERVLETLILIALAVAFIVAKFNNVLSVEIAVCDLFAYVGLLAYIEIKESKDGRRV